MLAVKMDTVPLGDCVRINNVTHYAYCSSKPYKCYTMTLATRTHMPNGYTIYAVAD